MAETKFFPNIPVTHWLNLRNQFKRTIPGTISPNYLASVLGMTEASAKANITPSLRQIGLIDTEGKTNQELARKLRDDSLYPDFCNEVLEKIYPQELRDAFPDKNSNRDKIKTWFMNHTGVGDSAANRIVAFYTTLLEADPNVAKTNNGSKNGESKPKAAKAPTKNIAKPKSNQSQPDSNSEHSSIAQPKQSNNAPDLNINIQIHISSDASPDQIKSIFENMAKYLYKS